MAKTISEIYKEYKIMPSLEMHMLRVAAVAHLICDNFEEPLPKDEIITACLLHDIGNIIKFKLDVFPEFLKPEGLEYWKGVKEEYINKYGQDEHEASLRIMRELTVSERAINMADEIEFTNLCNVSTGEDIAHKIVAYADSRVGPHEIMSLLERWEDGRRRYQERPGYGLADDDRHKFIACGQEIEKQIFAKCKIKPEDINDGTARPIIEELRNFMIRSTSSGSW